MISSFNDENGFLWELLNMFEQKIFQFIKAHNIIQSGDSVVVGLSGGADSVSLIAVLSSLKKKLGIEKIVAVHINHMIRGEEAYRDEAFAKKISNDFGVDFFCYRNDIPKLAVERGMTVEEAGRSYRYECFVKTAKENGCNKIAVAHNANDVAETVLFNLVRGSGIKGLSGIPCMRQLEEMTIVRPLIEATRAEIEKYLSDNKTEFINDSTNFDVDYDRNRIRHIILPELTKLNQMATKHICDLANEAGEYYDFIYNEKNRVKENVTDSSGIDIKKLLCLDDLMINGIIYDAIVNAAGKMKDISRAHVKSVRNILEADTGAMVNLPYDVIARINYEHLVIEKNNTDKTGKEQIIIDLDNLKRAGDMIKIDYGNFNLEIVFDTVDSLTDIPKNNYTKIVDYDKIKDTLCIRTVTDGDYITINSQGNTKKISRVFIDNKIDRNDREIWPLIADDNQVIWVVGLRYNDAYRIDDRTKKVLILKYSTKE